jgi:hypothetical protein
MTLSRCAPSKSFRDFTRADVITYLDQFRKDESIDPIHKWVGTVTFTASKPIEVDVEHKYDPKVIPDAKHGAPYNAKWIDNTTRIALSPMTMFSNTPVALTQK